MVNLVWFGIFVVTFLFEVVFISAVIYIFNVVLIADFVTLIILLAFLWNTIPLLALVIQYLWEKRSMNYEDNCDKVEQLCFFISGVVDHYTPRPGQSFSKYNMG